MALLIVDVICHTSQSIAASTVITRRRRSAQAPARCHELAENSFLFDGLPTSDAAFSSFREHI